MKFISEIKKLLLLTALLSTNALGGQYDFKDGSDLQYSGYIGYTQKFSNSQISNTFSGTEKPEIGFNVIYNRGNFQVFNQFRYGTTSGTALVYNFAQYSFNICEDGTFTIKGGKLRHELGLYNTSKINPKTRQGIIMPQGIYWDMFDEFAASGAGVSAEFEYKGLKISYTIDDPTVVDSKKLARTYAFGLLNNAQTSFGSHRIAAFTYSPYNYPLTIKGSWAQLNLGNDVSAFGAEIRKDLGIVNFTSEMATLGVEYKFDKLTISGEALYNLSLDQRWVRDFTKLSHGFSFTGIYEINDNLNLRFNYNQYNSALAAKVYKATPWMAYQKDFNVGLNYHTGPWMFQVEGHSISGGRVIDPKDVNGNLNAYKDWFIIGAQVVYSF